MLVAGIQLHRLYAAEIRHGCLGPSAWSHVCRPLQNTFGFGWPQSYTGLVMLVMQAVPVIIGVFLGAPLLAREYTAGTVRFAWTQSIGRTRWADGDARAARRRHRRRRLPAGPAHSSGPCSRSRRRRAGWPTAGNPESSAAPC